MRRLLPLAAACAILGACGGSGLEPLPDDAEFIALQEDFQGFMDWESFFISDVPLGDVHTTGGRYAYIAFLPDSDRTTFPVGTIIVKLSKEGDSMEDWPTLAMVKRGGGYNPDGSPGWEWFELQLTEDGDALIEWRGQWAPVGGGYGNGLGTDGDCNTCHGLAASNDYVMSPQLDLDDL